MEDLYKTIEAPSKETLFKEKGSKFFGYAFPVLTEEDVKKQLAILSKKHHSARHICYAYQLGVENVKFRANDDGEPNNSAGLPIYGQIQSFEVTNVLVVSVRYFGGVKLGVGGLITAYKTSAQLALQQTVILEKTIDVQFKLIFNYDLMNAVQRIIKEQKLKIVAQKLEINCEYIISTRKKNATTIFNLFDTLYKVDIKKVV